MAYYAAKSIYGTQITFCRSDRIGCSCKRADVHPVEWGKCKGTCRR